MKKKTKKYENRGEIDPPKKENIVYIGGNLPEFTVIAQKKENSSIDPFTYKNLLDIQNEGDKQVYDIWKSSGKPKINISDWTNRQTYESDTQSIDIGRNNGGIVENFLSEIPHAIQNTYYYPGNALQRKYESDVEINKTFTPEEKQKLYNIPGTLEHEAHSIIEPQVRQAYANALNNKKMFQLGGNLNGSNSQQKGQMVGNLAGTALSLAGIPGLAPLLGQLGSQIGAKQDMTKALQDHFNSMSTSTNPYGNYALGGEISGLDGLIKYDGASHANGGIQVNAQGIPSTNPVAEVEDGEVTMRSGNKSYVFSKKMKI